MILANVKTPNVYTDININTQRTGLLPNHQRVLFITDDFIENHLHIDREVEEAPIPVGGMDRVSEMDHHRPPLPINSVQDIYDTQSADQAFGKNSVAGRMMKAAVKTNRLVNVQAAGDYHFMMHAPLIEEDDDWKENPEIARPIAI